MTKETSVILLPRALALKAHINQISARKSATPALLVITVMPQEYLI